MVGVSAVPSPFRIFTGYLLPLEASMLASLTAGAEQEGREWYIAHKNSLVTMGTTPVHLHSFRKHIWCTFHDTMATSTFSMATPWQQHPSP